MMCISTSYDLPRRLTILLTGALLVMLVGCNSEKKQQAQLFGEQFATSRDTKQDPADLAGTWVGERLGGQASVTFNFQVSGNTYTGTFETGHGASGNISGTITGSEWSGDATQLLPVGPYEFKLGGMFTPSTMTWRFKGKGFAGEEQGTGFANKQ